MLKKSPFSSIDVNQPHDIKFATKNRDTILPTKTALIINDITAVLIFSLMAIIAIMLFSYDPNDNCWFKITHHIIPNNKLGILGAYLSDILLSLFGFSSWFLVVILFYLGYRKIIRKKISIGGVYNILQVISVVGLFIILPLFEYLLLNKSYDSYLHTGSGGLIGHLLYSQLYRELGILGVNLLTMILLIICFSLVFSMSISHLAQKIGQILECIYLFLLRILSHRHDEGHENKDIINDGNNSDNFDIADKLIVNKTFDLYKNEDNKQNIEHIPHNQQEHKINFTSILDKFKNNTSELNANESKTKEININKQVSKQLSQMNTMSDIKLLPSTNLLSAPPKQTNIVTDEIIQYVSNVIQMTLMEFGVEVVVKGAKSGPVVTRYEILPSKGVRGDKIVGLAKELARALALSSVRIIETIPGKNTMGIEVPNFKRQIIYLKTVFDSEIYQTNNNKLTLALGVDIAGNVVITDLAKMPHLLVAGTTGSGKSVAVNTMILSILFQATPQEVKLIMIDPKMVELSFYQDIPHLLAPVITDTNHAINALKWTVGEMERRYKIMAKIGCKNILSFNDKINQLKQNNQYIIDPFPQHDVNQAPIDNDNNATHNDKDNINNLIAWPYIVVIIDELADLMMSSGKKIEQYIVRIAQKARAVGIHLIVATQRPSVDVITGLIKANIPSRISFQVSSKIDSRTILDQSGAETLLGQGDMLFLQPGSGFPNRIHGAFVGDDELNKVIAFLKKDKQYAPEYLDEIIEGVVAKCVDMSEFDDDKTKTKNSDGEVNIEKDSIFDEVVAYIYESKRCSISSLQTRFCIGYNRSARIMAYLETINMVKRNEKGGFELNKYE